MAPKKPYKRVLIKLSGESLSGGGLGIQSSECQKIAKGIKALHDKGVEIGIVIGAGNIFRGVQASDLNLPQTPADNMGMLATIINGITLQHTLSSHRCPARVLSALDCPKAVESYNWSKAHQYLSDGKVVIFVGGTGNPYFTTDTAAAMRAGEIEADLILKMTKVDGVYDDDPIKNPEAKRYQRLTYAQVLAEKLGVMDATAIALCRNTSIPVLVLHMKNLTSGTIDSLEALEKVGTIISEGN